MVSKGEKLLCAPIPRDLWYDLELLTYVLRLEGNPKTKGEIVAEALKEHFERHKLEGEIARARQVYHIEDGED